MKLHLLLFLLALVTIAGCDQFNPSADKSTRTQATKESRVPAIGLFLRDTTLV